MAFNWLDLAYVSAPSIFWAVRKALFQTCSVISNISGGTEKREKHTATVENWLGKLSNKCKLEWTLPEFKWGWEPGLWVGFALAYYQVCILSGSTIHEHIFSRKSSPFFFSLPAAQSKYYALENWKWERKHMKRRTGEMLQCYRNGWFIQNWSHSHLEVMMKTHSTTPGQNNLYHENKWNGVFYKLRSGIILMALLCTPWLRPIEYLMPYW